MSNDICDLVLYIKNEGLNILQISRYNSILVLNPNLAGSGVILLPSPQLVFP